MHELRRHSCSGFIWNFYLFCKNYAEKNPVKLILPQVVLVWILQIPPPKIKMTSVFVHFVFILANSCILFASMLSILFCLSHTNTRRITVRHAD